MPADGSMCRSLQGPMGAARGGKGGGWGPLT